MHFDRSAPIWPRLRRWWQEEPDFFWAPVSPDRFTLDWVSGLDGVPVGGFTPAWGGDTLPQRRVIDPRRMMRWGTNFGMTASTPHVMLALVSGTSSSASGALLKVGNASTGWGMAHGGSDDATSGSKILYLREGIAWHASASSGAWVDGLQVVAIGLSSESGRYARNVTTGVEVAHSSAPNNPTADFFVQGRLSAYSSPFTVHAVAVFKRSLTNAATTSFREQMAAPFADLQRTSARSVREMFRPPHRILVPVSGGAPSLPTLSALTTKPGTLTSSGFTVRVTAS